MHTIDTIPHISQDDDGDAPWPAHIPDWKAPCTFEDWVLCACSPANHNLLLMLVISVLKWAAVVPTL